jgi:hypothetical protein
MSTHLRFKTIADMSAYVVKNIPNADANEIDYGIYSDDNHFSFRPQVIIYADDTYYLRWYAYGAEDQDGIPTSFFDRHARVDARDAARIFASKVMHALNPFNDCELLESRAEPYLDRG